MRVNKQAVNAFNGTASSSALRIRSLDFRYAHIIVCNKSNPRQYCSLPTSYVLGIGQCHQITSDVAWSADALNSEFLQQHKTFIN
jgi:hypothetical protein